MKNKNTFSCTIATTNSTVPLGIEIWLDNQQIFNQDRVTENITFCHDILDLDAGHELRFVMKNKTSEHTIVNDNGDIVEDTSLVLSDLAFDDIALGYIMTEKAEYTHNFNGNGDPIKDRFFGQMGCNGVVSLKFTTPMHLWLLENM
jgi:hypothetical protein